MKQKSPLVFKLENDLNTRLEKCAKELNLKKYTLGIMAIQAAVEAVEKNDYRLVLPVKFQVEDVAVPRREAGPSPTAMTDEPPPYRTKPPAPVNPGSLKDNEDKVLAIIEEGLSTSPPPESAPLPKASYRESRRAGRRAKPSKT